MSDRKTTVLNLILLAGVASMCLSRALQPTLSADILALWLAGVAVADGLPHLVYPAETMFTLRPPTEWIAMAEAAGHDGQIFPYIYPPLTAALVAKLTAVTSFAVFAKAVLLGNIALGLGTSWLAWRASGRPVPLPVFLFLGTAIFHHTIFGNPALDQGQPQILVAFLCVLCIERLQARDDRTAGAVLALAAAIKVLPALYLIFLIATRRWSAVAAFSVVGAALAGASVLLAGWPLHAAFLEQIAAISRTSVTMPLNFSLDGLVPLVTGLEQGVPKLATTGYQAEPSLTGITSKGPVWSLLDKVALVAALSACVMAFRKRGNDPLLWAGSMAALSLVSPLAWSYHFLASVAFAPALMARWGPGPIVVIFLPLSIPVLAAGALGLNLVLNLAPIGFVLTAVFALACILRPQDLRLKVLRPTAR